LFDLDPAGFGAPHHRLVMRPNFGQDQADYTAVTDDDYAIGRIYEDRHTRPTVDGQLGKEWLGFGARSLRLRLCV
jgi:hypothetical protein